MITDKTVPNRSGCTTLEMNVTFSGLVETVPMKIAFYKVLTLRNGSKKHCSQVVQVTDESLAQRLRDDVKPGDRIRVIVETDWTAKDMPSTLKDFQPIPCPDNPE